MPINLSGLEEGGGLGSQQERKKHDICWMFIGLVLVAYILVTQPAPPLNIVEWPDVSDCLLPRILEKLEALNLSILT